MSKNFFPFLRLFVLLLGFVIICLGAFCISKGASACQCNSLPIAYLLLPLGFLFLLSGIFWSTYHEASKCKSLFQRLIQRHSRYQDTHINTVDRPDFYPPSYEDSTDPEKPTFQLPVFPLEQEKEIYNIPPPLYTESSLDFIEETGTQDEQPPSYELSLQRQPTECDSTQERTSCAPVMQSNC